MLPRGEKGEQGEKDDSGQKGERGGKGESGVVDTQQIQRRILSMLSRWFTQIAANGDSSVALDEQGRVWAWGVNNFG